MNPVPSALRLAPARTGLMAQAAYRLIAGGGGSVVSTEHPHSFPRAPHPTDRCLPWYWPEVAQIYDGTRRHGFTGRLVPASEPPPIAHVYEAHDQAWVKGALAILRADLRDVCDGPTLRLRRAEPIRQRAAIQLAVSTMFHLWPEAALEWRLLVRNVVYLEAPVVLSATLSRTFGAVYCSDHSLQDQQTTMMTLLRESAVHALWLQMLGTPLVERRDTEGSHPDRRQRTALGALYSAQANARVANFFARACQSADATPHDQQARGEALARAYHDVGELAQCAQLTPAGDAYLAELKQDIKAITNGHAIHHEEKR